MRNNGILYCSRLSETKAQVYRVQTFLKSAVFNYLQDRICLQNSLVGEAKPFSAISLLCYFSGIGTSLQLNPVYTRQQNDTCDIFPEIIIQEKGTSLYI